MARCAFSRVFYYRERRSQAWMFHLTRRAAGSAAHSACCCCPAHGPPSLTRATHAPVRHQRGRADRGVAGHGAGPLDTRRQRHRNDSAPWAPQQACSPPPSPFPSPSRRPGCPVPPCPSTLNGLNRCRGGAAPWPRASRTAAPQGQFFQNPLNRKINRAFSTARLVRAPGVDGHGRRPPSELLDFSPAFP